MWSKVVLISATVLAFSQALDLQKSQSGTKALREFVEIDNATYFLDMETRFHRDAARRMCQSMNMTLVSFEGDEQKWRSINQWISDNGYGENYFWIDALKDKDSTEWYWETSGNKVSANDFHWAADQPSLSSALVRTCISFSSNLGGYDDDDCLPFNLCILCQ